MYGSHLVPIGQKAPSAPSRCVTKSVRSPCGKCASGATLVVTVVVAHSHSPSVALAPYQKAMRWLSLGACGDICSGFFRRLAAGAGVVLPCMMCIRRFHARCEIAHVYDREESATITASVSKNSKPSVGRAQHGSPEGRVGVNLVSKLREYIRCGVRLAYEKSAAIMASMKRGNSLSVMGTRHVPSEGRGGVNLV